MCVGILDSHSSNYDDLVICDTVYSGISPPIFRRNTEPSSPFRLYLAGYFLALHFDPECESSTSKHR
jgi:hypothetical protein